MKCFCPISGLTWESAGFSGIEFSSQDTIHPIFHLPQRSLLNQTSHWAKGEFSGEENYLLFLALLNSSELVSFRTPAFYQEEKTSRIIANNYEKLLRALTRLAAIPEKEKYIPRLLVSKENQDLSNISGVLQTWVEGYRAFRDNYAFSGDFRALQIREAALQRILRSSHRKEVSNTALANWAELAGNFPAFQIIHPNTKQRIALNDYWKELIQKCGSKNVFNIPEEKDLRELYEHCEQNIEPGSIYSRELYNLFQKALRAKQDFLGENMDLSSMNLSQVRTTFNVLTPESQGTETKHLPLEEPKQSDYPDKISFIRAKMSWSLAKQAARESGNVVEVKVQKVEIDPIEHVQHPAHDPKDSLGLSVKKKPLNLTDLGSDLDQDL